MALPLELVGSSDVENVANIVGTGPGDYWSVENRKVCIESEVVNIVDDFTNSDTTEDTVIR